MKNQYLKPMLDPGSPRVFNVNEMTQRILAEDENAPRFWVLADAQGNKACITTGQGRS